ncbi:hypothetical protein [Thalassobaculum sp.]|uniref:hypothetical protein n=1 Tax=Thalassobaculum sp. TaxID=2022740 RepID=UPI0032ED835E
MERSYKAGLLAGVSALAFGLAILPMQADAFERVQWRWDARVHTDVDFDADIDVNVDPSGIVMVEDLQISIGDIRAVSRVTNIQNNQPNADGGEVDLGQATFSFIYDGNTNLFTADNGGEVEVVAGSIDENGNIVSGVVDLGTVVVPPSGSYDALTELPSVVSAATAVANNTSITSGVSTQIHEAQVAVGFADGPIGGDSFLGLGGLQKANISALSDVSNILNATVDSSATAVANNLTVELNAATPDDAVLIMDAQQWSFADVRAVSDVRRVTLNNYTNLGALDRPIVSSVATAVGNNKSITVNVPGVGGN